MSSWVSVADLVAGATPMSETELSEFGNCRCTSPDAGSCAAPDPDGLVIGSRCDCACHPSGDSPDAHARARFANSRQP